MKSLPALQDRPEYWHPIKIEIESHLKKEIYLPFLRAIEGEVQIENSFEDLFLAVSKGHVQYVNGHFEGKFDSTISRELKKLGAVYDRTNSWWELERTALPADLRVAIGSSLSRFQAMSRRAQTLLDSLSPKKIADTLSLKKHFDTSIFKMDQQFKANVRRIGVKADISEEQRRFISQRYTDNSELDIKGWSESRIEKLRQYIQKNTFEGGLRREGLLDDIQKDYGVSQRKAQFLARQETGLLMSAFQEKKYVDAGLPRYTWNCVHGTEAHPVRVQHEALNGKVYNWNNPPLKQSSCGRPCHPGEDYNCRCTAIPYLG